jgi:thymidylate synthase
MLSNIIKEKYDHEEKQYLSIVKEIILSGDKILGRNGYTYSKNGISMYFNLENDVIPILTTKKMAVKTCMKELLWFISGKTDNKILNQQNVHIWDDNASIDFMQSRNLHYEEGDLGPIYGHQWRHYNAKYKDCNTDYKGQGVDQLNNIIQMLKDPKEKYSRRIILNAWNPCQLEEMALPPCHILVQFNVSSKDELSCSLYQRSGDMGLGVPFNILSYSLLTILLAKHCGLKPKEFIHHIGNAHVYDDHIEELNKQVQREPYMFPTITIKKTYESIDEYKLEDIEIINYKCHENIILNMRK